MAALAPSMTPSPNKKHDRRMLREEIQEIFDGSIRNCFPDLVDVVFWCSPLEGTRQQKLGDYLWLDVCVDLTGSSLLTQTEMVDIVPGQAVIDVAQRKRTRFMVKSNERTLTLLGLEAKSLRSSLQLSNDIAQLKHSNCSVEVYYQIMKGYSDEIDALEAPYMCICNCTCENGRLNGARESRKRLIQFLMGLDESFANLRGQILLIQPLPTATKAYGMLRHEEKQRESVTLKHITPTIMSIFTNNNHPSQSHFRQNRNFSDTGNHRSDSNTRRSTFKQGVICGNFQKEGHYKSECYQLVGYPVGHPLHGKVRPINTSRALNSRPREVNIETTSEVASTSTRETQDDVAVQLPNLTLHHHSPPELQPDRRQPQPNSKITSITKPSTLHLINSLNTEKEPTSYKDASKHPKWVEETNKELDALESNNTWELTLLPPNKQAIGSKWVYRIKYKADGSVERYKGRLVAKRFNQKEGVDYTETFAPVAKMVTVRTILTIATVSNWHIHQLDINNAFLHGDFDEVYMTLPSGYNKKVFPNAVCVCVFFLPSHFVVECLDIRHVTFQEHIYPYHKLTNTNQTSSIPSSIFIPQQVPSPIFHTSPTPSSSPSPEHNLSNPSPSQTKPVITEPNISQPTPEPIISNSPPSTPTSPTPTNTTTESIQPTTQSHFTPPLPTRTSTRQKTTSTKLKDYIHYKPPSQINFIQSKHRISHFINYHNITKPSTLHLINSLNTEKEPTSYKQASKHPKWVEEMNKELDALESNNIWELTPLPPNKQAIGSKWVYRIKYKADGSVKRYKGRLVAKRSNQKEGVDYTETFAPVAKMVTVRTILTMATVSNWHIHQLDINNAFLHGDLDEEVYMTLPSGYNKKVFPNAVCKLKKSLYGLKHANRQWFTKLTTFLLSLGFKQSKADTSLLTYFTKDISLVLLIYVDDILITGNSLNFINIKQQLHNTFSIKDHGPLHYYLSIQFIINEKGLVMTQRKYAFDLIEHASLIHTKHARTPLDPNINFTYDSATPLTDPSYYRTLVGKLIYLTIGLHALHLEDQ
nr:retrovirus-related Pol polyprotein from transposon TNT 1-94 [Tanacetum cinerariifolium]